MTGLRYKNVEIGLKYIADIASMYGITRRAASKRLEMAGIRGVLIGKRAYYKMTKELDEILSKPSRKKQFSKKNVEKEKILLNNFPRTVRGLTF